MCLGISVAQKIGCDCHWYAFGTGSTFQYIDSTALVQALGEAKCGVHVAYGHVELKCIRNLDVHHLFAECNSA